MTLRRMRNSAFLVIAGLAAACTTASGVATRESNISGSQPSPTSDPSPGQVTTTVDGSTTVVEPSAAGLPALDEPDPAIVIGVLENGLRYFIRENDNPGVNVEMRLVVDAGSGLEDPDQGGGAHFLEHMLFNGTEMFPENELIAVLRSFGAGFGADINAYTNYDETVYELSMPSDDPAVVDTGLDVLQQWLSAATLDAGAVEAERGVVLDEWRTSEQRADGRIFDAIEDLFLGGTPYEGRDPIGTPDAIEGTVAEPLRRFYDDWYRPDNVALVVVGDIEAETIEQGITDRFASATSRGSAPERVDLAVVPAAEPRALVLNDPDVAQGFALVNLPLPVADGLGPEEAIQRAILGDLAFSIIATRLSNAALRGEVPFDDAYVDASSVVRLLDAPEVVVEADGAAMEASVRAILDEYERVRRFGFTASEVQRAVAAERSVEDSFYAGRESRQDSAYADQYVDHVLEDAPIATADSDHALVTAILESATPETVAYGLVTRLASAGPRILVVVPESEADAVPDPRVFEDLASSVSTREIEPVDDGDEPVRALMATPAPVEERSQELLSDGFALSFVRPTLLTFDNGARVSLNPTDIVEGSAAFSATSAGGLAAVEAGDVPDAVAAGPVVDGSGLGDLDRVAVETFLADKDVGLRSFVDLFTEGFDGYAASADLEVLFQLVHLRMTEPRLDPVAFEQYLDDELPYANDRSIDPITAEYAALLDARYDDPRFLLPTADGLASVDAAGIDRVYRDRFGDAGDWVFALSGDFDVDLAIELSRRYVGTLPSTDRVERADFVEPPPPPGVVVEQVNAGQGDTATVSFLFTAPASADRRDDVAARLVQELVSSRLTDSIREELGESYSPYAFVQLTGGATPNVEVYISLSADPDRVDVVSDAVKVQLANLLIDGPTPAEYSAATEKVARDVNLYTNQAINTEVLALLVDPAGNPDFDDYLDEGSLVDTISRPEIVEYLNDWVTIDQYIEVRVLPR